ncbi:MAG: PEP-CTERM sorting domain-containing protein [Phycisphaerae bacterium]|nr:PEP-CTERM sorting domain-containing protein [Phycisphaerae bacterium]
MSIALLLLSANAFGWGGPSHSAMCHQVFDDPVVSPLLSQISNISTIEDFIGEPASGWQDGQWGNVQARAYIPGISSPNGKNWDSLDETTRLKYMMHNVGDVAVPIGHSPACYNPNGYSNTIAEAALEAQVSTWSTYPDIEGTTTWYNDETGHTYHYTGTIYDVLEEHYYACRDNRDWFKAQPTPWYLFGAHTTGVNHDAGWNGTAIAQMLMRAMIVDYILHKVKAATIGDVHYLPGSNSYDFDANSSYDKDNIIWQSNGTYTQAGGGLDEFYWDVNDDGTWESISTTGHVYYTAAELIAMGLTPNSKVYYPFAMIDDEGKWHESRSWFNFYPGGGVPEPTSLSLLAVGAIAIVKRRRR